MCGCADAARAAIAEALAVLSHSDFVAIMLCGLVLNLHFGVTLGLGTYFNRFLWQWAPRDTAEFEVLAGVGGLGVSLCASTIARRSEKRSLALRLFAICVLVGPMLLTLRLADRWLGLPLLPPNGPKYGPLWWLMLLHGVSVAIPTFLCTILVGSMLADVVEDSQRSTGRRHEGLFLAGPALLQKSVSGLGSLVKGWLLRVTGFADAVGDAAKAVAIERVAGAVLLLSICLPLVALSLLSRYRISRHAHERNLRELGYNV